MKLRADQVAAWERAKKKTASCSHATIVHGCCAFCGALRCEDGSFEEPLAPGGVWNPDREPLNWDP